MKFVADRMLGRLARWLRLFGYDTTGIKKQENEDDLLLDIAEKEKRILISRDRMLIRRAVKRGITAYYIQSQDITEQLRGMHDEFNISFEPAMDRCTLCNSTIRRVKEDDMELVLEKDYVNRALIDAGTEFWICDKCGQVYWLGKHWEDIRERVGKL